MPPKRTTAERPSRVHLTTLQLPAGLRTVCGYCRVHGLGLSGWWGGSERVAWRRACLGHWSSVVVRDQPVWSAVVGRVPRSVVSRAPPRSGSCVWLRLPFAGSEGP